MQTQKHLDEKSLHIECIRNSFIKSIETQLKNSTITSKSATQMSQELIDILQSTANKCLTPVRTQSHCKEIWKDDTEFNKLITLRHQFKVNDIKYKEVTRAIKKRVIHLRNEKLQREANEINENASRRQVEQLYRSMKDGNTTFRKLHGKQNCDPSKLKEHFISHFNSTSGNDGQIHNMVAEKVLEQLRGISGTKLNDTSPDLKELLSTIQLSLIHI